MLPRSQPAQPGVNLQAAVVADHLLAVRREFDGEGVPVLAKDVSPGQVEPRLAVLEPKGRGILRGYLQRALAAAKLPDPSEIGLRHTALRAESGCSRFQRDRQETVRPHGRTIRCSSGSASASTIR